ncbi:carbohydrate esterase [Streptomyces marokkonensis]|uniref:carbohydrate esterase n=1 Tax=Streptomyces marokkonensis TaxID=324855 RepID=UPI0011F351E5|nr:carbohydrate esterase [Streptomyces marokkonensis]
MGRAYRPAGRAVLTAAVALGVGLTAVPAQGHQHGRSPVQGIEHCAATACHFALPPGTYDVRVTLGGDDASSTAVGGETRRALLPETAVPAGERTVRGFTVNVRTPEGEPLGPGGTPGLDLTVGGAAPALAGIRVTPARHARQILLIGDSTVCDQPGDPYSGWGRRLPQYLRKGLSVANYADSGESTVSYLGNPLLWDTVRPLIRHGDLTLDNDTALLVNGLGVDHPAVIRSVAADRDVPLIDLTARTKALVESFGVEGSKALYLYDEKRDNTHTSVHGATLYADLVREELVDLRLVPEGGVRVG